MTNAPEWIEWGPDSPGYPNHPMPDGNDVEIIFRGDGVRTRSIPEIWFWRHQGKSADVVRYRDWTAFEQAKARQAEPSDEALGEG